MTHGILQHHAGLLSVVLRFMDAAVIALSGYLAYLITNDWQPLPQLYLWPLIIATLFTLLIFPQFGIYRGWRGIAMGIELRTLITAWITVVVALLSIGAITQLAQDYSVGWFVSYTLIGGSLLASSRLALRSILKWMRSVGMNQRKIVLVGGGSLACRVAMRLKGAPWTGLVLQGFFGDHQEPASDQSLQIGANESTLASQCTSPSPALPVKRLGGLLDVASYVEEHGIDQVWLAMPLSDADVMRRVLHNLRHSTADIRFVPDIFGFRLLNHSVTSIADVPVVNLTSTPMMGINRLVKAVEDWLLAFMITVAISPIMLVIAIAVRLSSEGPILFKQLRHGWDGRPIKVYKFRTMYIHQEGANRVTQATKDDPRVTPIGRFLRKTSLDELPQFINVLQGVMSVVGPRPHAIQHNEEFKDQVDRYMLRHKVKPGITGWAQVNGYRGETDTLFKMQKRVEYDLYYIENWSLSFDLKIVFMTFYRGFVGKNVY